MKFLNRTIIPTVAPESQNNKFLFFGKITKNKLKFNIKKKIHKLLLFTLKKFKLIKKISIH